MFKQNQILNPLNFIVKKNFLLVQPKLMQTNKLQLLFWDSGFDKTSLKHAMDSTVTHIYIVFASKQEKGSKRTQKNDLK